MIRPIIIFTLLLGSFNTFAMNLSIKKKKYREDKWGDCVKSAQKLQSVCYSKHLDSIIQFYFKKQAAQQILERRAKIEFQQELTYSSRMEC